MTLINNHTPIQLEESDIQQAYQNEWIRPDWSVPSNVKAFVTVRHGDGYGFNVATHVGDDRFQVLERRRVLSRALAFYHQPQWLRQVHGTQIISVEKGIDNESISDEALPEADGAYTKIIAQPLMIMTADCLPVFLCDDDGTEVALVHAGWRGLAAGVIEAALEEFVTPTDRIQAWLGPAIGPAMFEVGEEVRAAFLSVDPQSEVAFTFGSKVDHQAHEGKKRSSRWFADLYQLATLRLNNVGVTKVSGGGFCTYSDPRFFSYRREGETGRLLSCLYVDHH